MPSKNEIIYSQAGRGRHKICLSCGAGLDKRKRRYCSKDCKDLLIFALRWLKNLLLALNTNYATFSFSEYLLVVNILPYRSEEVFSFFYQRTPGRTPAEDLKAMCIELSREWYNNNQDTNCRALASIHILKKGLTGIVAKDLVKPVTRKGGANIKRQLKALRLSLEDVESERSKEKVKAAYRKEAMKTHPDVGGDGEKFKIVSESYQELIQWLKSPSYVVTRGVPEKWSYDGQSYKWRAPL